MIISAGKKCECGGRQWLVLQPGNLVCPCFLCAGDKSIYQIQEEREVEIGQDDNGIWGERALTFYCGVCGDTGEVHRAYVQPKMGMCAEALALVPCPKCRPALSHLTTTIGTANE